MSVVRLTKTESVNERVGERRPTSRIPVPCFRTCGAVTRTDSTSRCTSVQHKQIIQPNRHFFRNAKAYLDYPSEEDHFDMDSGEPTEMVVDEGFGSSHHKHNSHWNKIDMVSAFYRDVLVLTL